MKRTTITIEKNKAINAYNKGTDSDKKFLEDLLGKEMFKPTRINIKTKVVHATNYYAYDIIKTENRKEFIICRIPYVFISENNTKGKTQAKKYADFISHCFNNEK